MTEAQGVELIELVRTIRDVLVWTEFFARVAALGLLILIGEKVWAYFRHNIRGKGLVS